MNAANLVFILHDLCLFCLYICNSGLRNIPCLEWLGTLLNVVIPRSNQDGEEISGVGKVFELVLSPFIPPVFSWVLNVCIFLFNIESGCGICQLYVYVFGWPIVYRPHSRFSWLVCLFLSEST